MAKSVTFVSAAVVRDAFRTGALDATKVVDAKGNPVSTASLFGASGDSTKVRGRIHPAFVAAFNAVNKSVQYAEKRVKAEAMVEIPRVSVDSKGRKRALKPVTLPASEVRALAGESGKRGRIGKDTIAKASAALAKR